MNVRRKENKELQKRVAELEKQLVESQAKEKVSFDKWMEGERGKGAALADSMERKKLEKQLRVIGHIVSGRSDSAIKEILEPMPVLFTMQVAFADDKTKFAAEDEQLEKLKNLIVESVKGTKIKRAARWEAEAKSDGTVVAEWKDGK